MKLTFYIQYKTIFGEELVLNVVTPQTDATPEKIVPYRMSTRDGLDWSYELNIAEPHPTCIEYYYSVECNGHEKCHEWTVMKHRVELSLGKASYEIYDHWNNIPEDSYRYSAAFAIDEPETVTATIRRVASSGSTSAHHNSVAANASMWWVLPRRLEPGIWLRPCR